MPSTLVALSSRSAPISTEHHHAAVLEMAHGAAADEVLADLVDADRRLHAHLEAEALDGVLDRERVDDRGEHAHLVAGDAVHAGTRQTFAAEDVAAADHHRHLHTGLGHALDLVGDEIHHVGRNAEVELAHEGLAGKLEENARVERPSGRWVGHEG